jgi:hypothetical protein
MVPVADHHLEAVELGRIVAAGDHHAAIGFQMDDRSNRAPAWAPRRIGDVAAAGFRPRFDQGIAQTRRAQAHVAPRQIFLPGVAL